jgi:hypothetical protein
LSKTVPAGDYVISAKANLTNEGDSNGLNISCELEPNNLDFSELGLDGAYSDYGSVAPVMLQATATFSTSTTVTFECGADNGSDDDVVAQFASLNLIKVDTIS